MTDTIAALADETYSDRVLNFSIPPRNVRGRIVRLDDVLNTILDAHDYPPAIAHLLAEAVMLSALMGGLVKEEGAQLTIQAQMTQNQMTQDQMTQDQMTQDQIPEGEQSAASTGAVSLLVCDFRAGALRGYAEFDQARLASLGANPNLETLFGKGYLAITFDRGGGDHGGGDHGGGVHGEAKGRYQGIVPLEGETLSVACERYFAQSEQIPSLFRTAIISDGERIRAAGMLLQHLADGEEGHERLHVRRDHPEWEHVAVMAGSLRHEELLDPALSMEALVWRLFHEEDEVRVSPGVLLTRGCRCSVSHYEAVLRKFSEQDKADMRDETGLISVNCAFCSKIFAIDV